MTLFLIEFLFRISLGVSAAMAMTPPRHVTSGFYRVHLWVLLGINTLAALLGVKEAAALPAGTLPLAVASSVIAYVGSVFWLYEKKRAGRIILIGLALISAASAILLGCAGTPGTASVLGWKIAASLSSGLTVGFPLTAMFLGHWYLNTPSMDIFPLKRLLYGIVGTTLLRALVCGLSLLFYAAWGSLSTDISLALLALRWLAGIAGLLFITAMTWQTLKIPNTQSATGLLYVAVLFALLGELTSLLLSAAAGYPL